PTVTRSVYDVSGAGDTVVATVAVALAAGATIEEAAVLANHAAGVEVGKAGVATVSPDELRAALRIQHEATADAAAAGDGRGEGRMAKLQQVQTDDGPQAIGPYSQAIVVDGMVYTAGQIALDPRTKEIARGGIAEQTERVMQNLRAILEKAGASLGK